MLTAQSVLKWHLDQCFAPPTTCQKVYLYFTFNFDIWCIWGGILTINTQHATWTDCISTLFNPTLILQTVQRIQILSECTCMKLQSQHQNPLHRWQKKKLVLFRLEWNGINTIFSCSVWGIDYQYNPLPTSNDEVRINILIGLNQ